MGGPATGKGTRSKILANAIGVPHISTGELLRSKSKDNIEMSNMLKEGKLIPDDIMEKILKERIEQPDCMKGFVLDGYPRTYEQAVILDKMLNKMGRKINKVMELNIPEELAYKRILERKKCEKCGKLYGLDFPPKQNNVCDICGGALSVRSDDTKETLKNRIETYKENSKDILQYYKEKGILMIVDASSHAESVIEDAKC